MVCSSIYNLAFIFLGFFLGTDSGVSLSRFKEEENGDVCCRRRCACLPLNIFVAGGGVFDWKFRSRFEDYSRPDFAVTYAHTVNERTASRSCLLFSVLRIIIRWPYSYYIYVAI